VKNIRVRFPILIGLALFGAMATARSASGQATCAERGRRIGTVIIDSRPDGVSSDGRGSYVPQTDGVIGAFVATAAGFALTSPRALSVNLNHPVAGGGGVPLGVITTVHALGTAEGFQQPIGINTQLTRTENRQASLLCIAPGRTEPAAQISVTFYIDGRLHLLQMGPQPFGHGHPDWQPLLIHGAGTSSGTVSRTSATTWAVDLPAGSVGRLFDLYEGPRRAVDKGLYNVQLRYEIADAVPGVSSALQPVAQRQGAVGVVERYRALKRDSSRAYFFGDLGAVGFWFLDNKRADDAVTVFRLNVEENPRFADGYVGLGEAYLAIGDTARAVVNYRRALELNPRDQVAADFLRRLGARP